MNLDYKELELLINLVKAELKKEMEQKEDRDLEHESYLSNVFIKLFEEQHDLKC